MWKPKFESVIRVLLGLLLLACGAFLVIFMVSLWNQIQADSLQRPFPANLIEIVPDPSAIEFILMSLFGVLMALMGLVVIFWGRSGDGPE